MFVWNDGYFAGFYWKLIFPFLIKHKHIVVHMQIKCKLVHDIGSNLRTESFIFFNIIIISQLVTFYLLECDCD